ncbi:inositol monophosphatase family protein [Aerosticca soli]|uniref:Nus factor SuhB n=1 Tax=Aerosticca soli TaxID=2010829 RepID=A0A2Z6E3S4_9GAMM|nr:inositol monophosphatase family protein [Aerosticca soli]BBD79572.1 histidinol-phosphatase [alternative form] [Aerosticca soli]
MHVERLAHALEAARAAAQAAAQVILRHWQSGVAVEWKSDATPVTQADREAEQAIRAVLARALPEAGIYGEEYGRSGNEHLLWLVDPLDGTKSFVRRTPFFSTQIALMEAGELVLGVSCAPVYGETMWAARGMGAWLDGRRVTVADTARLEQAALSTGNIKSLAADARWAAFGELVRTVDRIRGYGDFCHYHLLARGALDLVLESDVHVLDVAALAVIVREAGGIFTDLDGQPPGLATRSVLAGVPALHAQALARLRAAPRSC